MEGRLRIGDIVQHFKRETVDQAGDMYLYEITDFAVHSETRERYVVYRALYADGGTFIRPYDMFMGEVDRVKYPNIRQTYRFELVRRGQ